MTSDNAKTASPPQKDPDALRAEIAEIRAELGDTVEALAAKADVKAQAQAKVEQKKEQLREKVGQTRAQLGQTAETLKSKAADRTGQLRERAEVGRVKAQASSARGKQALSRYAPWPQVAAGAAAVLVVLVIGGRQIQARRATTPTQRMLRRVGRR